MQVISCILSLASRADVRLPSCTIGTIIQPSLHKVLYQTIAGSGPRHSKSHYASGASSSPGCAVAIAGRKTVDSSFHACLLHSASFSNRRAMSSRDSSATAIGKSERLLSGYDSDSEGGYSPRPQRQKSSKISLVLNILLGTACSILLFVVFRQRATFKNTFGCPLEQPGAPVIHTHGVEPPMLGPECMIFVP